MKKTIFAMGGIALSCTAAAQPEVAVYGYAQDFYLQKTNDGKSGYLTDWNDNLLGAAIRQDIGHDSKVFVVLEEKYKINSGESANSNLQFTETSMLGVTNPHYGELALGRAATVLDVIYSLSRAEAFQNTGTGAFCPTQGCRRGNYTSRYDRLVRYTSPEFGGVRLMTHYGITNASTGGTGTSAQAKIPFGAALSGTWNKLFAEAGFQRDTTALNGVATGTHFKTLIIDGGYDAGFAKFVTGYAHSRGYTDFILDNAKAHDTRFQVGTIIPVRELDSVRANIGRWLSTDATNTKSSPLTHTAIGYWYGLSKEFKLMAAVSLDRQKAGFTNGKDSQVGVEFGMKYDFDFHF